MYKVEPVNPALALNLEPLGTKRKYWYRHDGVRILFKAEERGTGEDWAEKVSCELAALLGLPHVHYDLAEEKGTGTPGVICASCAAPPVSLVLGNEILLALDEDYPVEQGQKYKVKAHTVDAVASAVDLIRPPPAVWLASVPRGIETALDVFVGYILLDAWVANQDRHHENWGVLCDKKALRLAPTFDHGSALARNHTDADRKKRLQSNDVNQQIPTFASKAKSAFFENRTAKRPLTTRAAWQAFAERAPQAAAIWLERLSAIDAPTVQSVLDSIPPARMSAVCRAFTQELLRTNQHYLLEQPQ